MAGRCRPMCRCRLDQPVSALYRGRGSRQPRSTARRPRSRFYPTGTTRIKNYYGGTPFPNPTEPNKGWKILANNFWFVRPALYVNTEQNYGTVWAVDRFGDIAPSSFDVVYRQSAYITDPGFPHEETYSPGSWQTQWGMQLLTGAGTLHCLAFDLLSGSGKVPVSRSLRVRAGLAPLTAPVGHFALLAGFRL